MTQTTSTTYFRLYDSSEILSQINIFFLDCFSRALCHHNAEAKMLHFLSLRMSTDSIQSVVALTSCLCQLLSQPSCSFAPAPQGLSPAPHHYSSELGFKDLYLAQLAHEDAKDMFQTWHSKKSPETTAGYMFWTQ